MLNRTLSLCVLASFAFALPCWAETDLEKTHHSWEVSTLRGIKSLRYGMSQDPSDKYAKAIAAAFEKSSVPAKAVNIKEDEKWPVAVNEGRVILYIDQRDKGQEWVGLSVQQLVKMERLPEITFAIDTYKTGALVPKSDTEKAIKDLCDKFIGELNSTQQKPL